MELVIGFGGKGESCVSQDEEEERKRLRIRSDGLTAVVAAGVRVKCCTDANEEWE